MAVTRATVVAVFLAGFFGICQSAYAECFGIDPRASAAVVAVAIPPSHKCTVRTSNGFPIPDPSCTPGAVDPTVTLDILKEKAFRTSCMRDKATSAHKKAATYDWYGVDHPDHNTGSTQTCELDHLISLELGGSDTLDNIWPQCGPDGVALNDRYFKQKDLVENLLAKLVREGKMDLGTAQRGIATDWTQFLQTAKNNQ